MDQKRKLSEIVSSGRVEENLSLLLEIVPEIRNMIGFDHKHPHHHLDVWQHTVEVLKNLENEDLATRMAGLFHDIGKPFSYQEGEVRHFRGHPEVSSKMTEKILRRLNYEEEFIKDVCYLVKTHDTVINIQDLDNSYDMIKKRLALQYADAKAHHPDKVKKRLDILDEIKLKLIERYGS